MGYFDIKDNVIKNTDDGNKNIHIPEQKPENILKEGDLLICAAKSFENRENLTLDEFIIDNNHKCNNKPLKDIKTLENKLIVMVQRGDKTILPNGDTILQEDDVVVIANYN